MSEVDLNHRIALTRMITLLGISVTLAVLEFLMIEHGFFSSSVEAWFFHFGLKTGWVVGFCLILSAALAAYGLYRYRLRGLWLFLPMALPLGALFAIAETLAAC